MDNNVIELVIRGNDNASGVVENVIERITGSFDKMASGLIKGGATLALAIAPLAGAFTDAVSQATLFEESMTNVQAVLGATDDQIGVLSDDILAIGANSRAGPQAAAAAFYDIVGGVADASTHMAILDSAIATAEAGSAELGSTTKALISVMNSYKFSADEASFASDVLTRTVGMGVGTMEEFAIALPQVSGLASSLKIDFDDLGAATAFLTTKGFSAAQAATQLRGMMTALLNPNALLKKAFAETGFESGEAAIKQLGLVGAYQALIDKSPTFQTNMAGAIGSVEALNGVTALAGGGFEEFSDKFSEGVANATAAARDIQLDSVAAQTDLLKASMSALRIEIGTLLLPTISSLVGRIRPVIAAMTEWVSENPELITRIGHFVGALAGLSAGMIAAGTAIKVVVGLVGLLTSPIALIVGAVAGLYMAWTNNWFGIRDTIEEVITPIVEIIHNDLWNELTAIGDALKSGDVFGILSGVGELFDAMVAIITGKRSKIGDGFAAIGRVVNVLTDQIGKRGLLGAFQHLLIAPNYLGSILKAFGMGQAAATRLSETVSRAFRETIIPAVEDVANFITDAFTSVADFLITRVLPVLGMLVEWFVNDLLPAVLSVVVGSVWPLIESFFDFLGRAWEIVSPGLIKLFDWFTEDALPAILGFISGTVIPAIGKFIDIVASIWNAVAPTLLKLLDWFINTGLPVAIGFVSGTVIPGIGKLIDVLSGVWDAVGPALGDLFKWFDEEGLPGINDALNWFKDDVLKPAVDALEGAWDIVRPSLQELSLWFVDNALPAINTAINWFKDNVLQPAIDKLYSIWSTISPTLGLVYGWFVTTGLPAINTAVTWFKDNILQPAIILISSIWTTISPVLNAVKDGFIKTIGWIADNVISPLMHRIEDLINKINELRNMFSTDQNFDQIGSPSQHTFDPRAIGRDSGGPGFPGHAYLIGRGAQPEVFVPSTEGFFIPNFDEAMNAFSDTRARFAPAAPQGGGNYYINVTVPIDSNTMQTNPDARDYGERVGAGIGETLREELLFSTRFKGGGVVNG